MKRIILMVAVATSFMACKSASNSENGEQAKAGEPQENVKAEVKNLKSSDLQAKLAEEGVVLIDVRTPGEVQEGFIPGASKFIDYNDESFEQEVGKLDKSKTYVVYCRSGGRSSNASKYMVDNGFQNVYNLSGGISGYDGELEH